MGTIFNIPLDRARLTNDKELFLIACKRLLGKVHLVQLGRGECLFYFLDRGFDFLGRITGKGSDLLVFVCGYHEIIVLDGKGMAPVDLNRLGVLNNIDFYLLVSSGQHDSF